MKIVNYFYIFTENELLNQGNCHYMSKEIGIALGLIVPYVHLFQICILET